MIHSKVFNESSVAVSFNRCFIFVLSNRFSIEGVIGTKYWDFAWSKQVWRFRWGFLVEFAPWIAMSVMGRDKTVMFTDF